MSQATENDVPDGFALVHERGPWDGPLWIAVCLRCDWQSAKTMHPESPFRKYGPATQHARDKHGTRVIPPGEGHS